MNHNKKTVPMIAGRKNSLKKIISSKGASICELVMDPNEEQIPKAINKRISAGKTVPTKLEDMYPFLSKKELNSNNYDR